VAEPPDPAAHAEVKAGGAKELVVADPAMVDLHEMVRLVARSDLAVLVTGETGVGKEMVSAAVHAGSRRKDGPYVRINCAALPESLLEAELFGYEKGAFTGAAGAKAGLLEVAHGGTLFLDEVGELPAVPQAKLLRFLENGEVQRIGALAPRVVDVRVVSATNRDLAALVTSGGFRRDLYFRLNGITVPVRPLRERRAEILPLAALFLEKAAGRAGVAAPSLARGLEERLLAHGWPGNVRELRNVMERALALAAGGAVRAEHLRFDPVVPPSAPPPDAPEKPRTLRLDGDAEKKLILEALAAAGGNQSRASEILGVSRRTLMNRMDQYGITRPRKG